MDYLAIIFLTTTAIGGLATAMKSMQASAATSKYDHSIVAIDQFAKLADSVYNSFSTPGLTGEECGAMATKAAEAWTAAKAAGPEIEEFLKTYEPVKK